MTKQYVLSQAEWKAMLNLLEQALISIEFYLEEREETEDKTRDELRAFLEEHDDRPEHEVA